MQVMTNIPSLDYSMFDGRKIAVYMKLDDLRTIQGDTVSNSAIWDFTSKYMNNVSIKENPRQVKLKSTRGLKIKYRNTNIHMNYQS